MLKDLLVALAVASSVSAPSLGLGDALPKAVPKLSGRYVFSEQSYCQPVISGSDLSNGGEVLHQIGTISFVSSNMTFSSGGTLDTGDALVEQGQGNAFNQQTNGGGGNYSNTETSVTINGNTYNAVYGHVASGIADYLTLMRLETTNGANCSTIIEMNHR